MESCSTRMKSPRAGRLKAAKALRKVPMALLLKKKAECDAKALKIVEQMMEPQVDVHWLLKNLPFVNKSHMEDVVEERSIVKLCGYVLCDEPLTKVVKKQYQISTARNKVYDVAKVKNYCSFGCYRAAEFLMEQIQTSPLWVREEEETPNFQLFEKRVSGGRASPPGVEINLTGIEMPRDCDEPEEKRCDAEDGVSEVEKSERLLEDLAKIVDLSLQLEGEKNEIPETKSAAETRSTVEKSICEEFASGAAKSRAEESENLEQDCAMETDSIENEEKHRPRVRNSARKPTSSRDSNPDDLPRKCTGGGRKTSETRSKVLYESLAARVEKSFREWMTEKTVCLLHGELEEKQKILERVKREEKYEILCKKLNRLRIEEEREAKENLGELKPAPNFLALQEEARGLELKVQAFWQGKTVIDPESSGTDARKAEEAEVNTVLPMIDLHAPNALRRRIFLDKLNKVIPDLLRTLVGQSTESQYLYDAEKCGFVKTLVSTFALDATNITFKTAEWTLVALLIIKLLGLMDQRTKFLLSNKQTTMYISMILMSYKLESNYLDNLIKSLTSPVVTRETAEIVNSNP